MPPMAAMATAASKGGPAIFHGQGRNSIGRKTRPLTQPGLLESFAHTPLFPPMKIRSWNA
jgi:hypothetical protein